MMLGWHFLGPGRTLRTGEIVQAGRTYTVEGPLALCRNVLHASRRALDALMYAPGPFVCRVQLQGEMLHDTDKVVARSCKVLWLADATRLLHEFALSVATDALLWTDTTDPRCWAALDAKTRWLRGYVTDQELDAARAAARAAAGAAARVAETAGAAAGDAARAAAWAAAWDAYNFQLETMLQSLR